MGVHHHHHHHHHLEVVSDVAVSTSVCQAVQKQDAENLQRELYDH